MIEQLTDLKKLLDAGVLTQGSYVHAVNPQPDAVTITAGPSGTPNPVVSGGGVSLSVSAADVYSHTLSYAWTATCPGLSSNGSFSPSATSQSPTWTAPANLTTAQETCTIGVTASDGCRTFRPAADGKFDPLNNIGIACQPKKPVCTATK